MEIPLKFAFDGKICQLYSNPMLQIQEKHYSDCAFMSVGGGKWERVEDIQYPPHINLISHFAQDTF